MDIRRVMAIATLGACLILQAGCDKPQRVAYIDPETQRELDEFERQLELETSTLHYNNEPQVVEATNSSNHASPAQQAVKDSPDDAFVISSEHDMLNRQIDEMLDESGAPEPSEEFIPELNTDSTVSVSANKPSAAVPDFELDNKERIAEIIDKATPPIAVADVKTESDIANVTLTERDIDSNKGDEIGGQASSRPAANISPETNTNSTTPASLQADSTTSTPSIRSSAKVPAFRPSQPIRETSARNIRIVDMEPEMVCREFLAALERSDQRRANRFLTNIAQIETARANLVLETPGQPGAQFKVLPVRYATSARNIAQVDCLLNQPNSETAVRLTWMMRRQSDGWKISGMGIQVHEDGTIDLLSFESSRDLARIERSVDQSVHETQTRVADQTGPENATLR